MASELPDSEEFVLNELLRRGLDDWAEAGEISDVIFNSARVTDPAIARRLVLRVVQTIIERGLMRAGTVTKEGFEPYSDEMALKILTRDWPDGHFPTLGELPFWLDLTSLGKQWLESRGLA